MGARANPWPCLLRLHRVDMLTENVTRYIRHGQKYDWISLGNPGPVSSASPNAMFCIYPRLNDDDGRGVDADDHPG